MLTIVQPRGRTAGTVGGSNILVRAVNSVEVGDGEEEGLLEEEDNVAGISGLSIHMLNVVKRAEG